MGKTKNVGAALKLKALHPTQAAHWSRLIETARADVSVKPLDGLHYGDLHWRATAAIGLSLAADTAVNPAVVLAFAILHDSQRRDRHADPDHGRRAAAIAETSPALKALLDPRDIARVAAACASHGDGLVAEDTALGICWDADRLAMVLRNKRPHAAYMSTQACQQDFDVALALARDIGAAPPSWTVLVAAVASHRTGPARPTLGLMRVAEMRGF